MSFNRAFAALAPLVFVLYLTAPVLSQESAEELYQTGLYQEEVQGNLEQAIQTFERILTNHAGQRTVAASALMHIGLCHEKLGSREAQRAYQRLLRDYADQVAVADQARGRLASLQGLARVEAPEEAGSGRGIVVRHLFGGNPSDVLNADGAPSPDGRFLAGVDWGPNASNIVVKDFVTGESRQLTDHPGYDEGMALTTSLSPDGNTVAYWWLTAEEIGEVRLAFRDGSPPRTLLAEPGNFDWPGPWREAGRSLLVSRQGPEGLGEWGWVSLKDGVFQRFETGPEMEAGPGNLTLSPDEQYLAFDFDVAADADRRDISMIPADGGAGMPIVKHPANDRVVGWVPGTNEFLFVSDRGGKTDLYAIEVADPAVPGDPRIILRDVGKMDPLGFTRGGDLFYHIYTLRMFIGIAPFDGETGTVDPDASQPLLGPKASPDWSPDGRSLTYWHKKDRPTNASDWNQVLGVSDLDTGEERELASHLEVERPRWSLDGRSILALALERDRKESEAPAFFSIDPETGDTEELLRFSPQPEWYWRIGAAQAPNGRDIVYVRDGRLVLHELATGGETELYRHPGLTSTLLEPSPDGRSLLFAVMDSTWSGLKRGTPLRLEDAGGKLMVARLPGGEVEELLAVDLGPGAEIRRVDWGPEGRYVYFTETPGDGPPILKRVSIVGGDPEVVWIYPKPMFELTISPTWDRVAFEVGENTADYYVMENLKVALQRMRGGW